MIKEIPKDLHDKGFISNEQFSKINTIVSGKVVSVFYELRTLLYLGIMLFTAGVGILIYQNIGEIGHLISVTALMLLDAFCFWYIFKNAPPYSNQDVKAPTPWFDYITLLSALLLISVIGYLQFLYEIFELQPELITLITAICFFFIAYRFDHTGILSLAITALASFWSISISPRRWYEGDFGMDDLYITGIIFSTALAGIALIVDRKSIKTHFTFTYINFCTLIFFVSAITGLFNDEWYGIYLLLIYGGCVFAFYMAKWKKSFLFLLYAFISAYTGTTYLLADLLLSYTAPELWFMYSIASCGGFVFFIVKFKSYFKQQP
jgi:hypothetical protein